MSTFWSSELQISIVVFHIAPTLFGLIPYHSLHFGRHKADALGMLFVGRLAILFQTAVSCRGQIVV